MTSLSNWSSEVPSGTSLIRKGDDQIRSEKQVEYNAWEEEHYWDSGSVASGGAHKTPLGPLIHVGIESESSIVGDTARLFFNSDRTALEYVGSEGHLQFVPSRYRAYHQRENGSPSNPEEVQRPEERLPTGKVWVMSVRTCHTTSFTDGSQFSWFAGTDYGPYDGVPNFIFSAVSLFDRASSTSKFIYEVRMLSFDSSNFTVTAAYWWQGNDGVKTATDAGTVINVLSLGTMDASRISRCLIYQTGLMDIPVEQVACGTCRVVTAVTNHIRPLSGKRSTFLMGALLIPLGCIG